MSGSSDHEPWNPVGQVRQRLEALRRAGVDRIPRPAKREVLSEPSPTIERPAEEPEVLKRECVVPTVTSRPEPKTSPVPSTPRLLFDAPSGPMPVIPVAERPALLQTLQAQVAACRECSILASTRTQTVFGEGSPSARLMFIGEAPGGDEDRLGRPFVGRAGQLLTDMITKGMGLSRESVYIANVLKCRPPENRNPLPDEVGRCRHFLERQIEIIRPEFLCLLGKIAASALLETALPMSRLRGRWYRYKEIPTIVTYHPAYLLRTPSAKRDAWEDLKMLMTAMGIKPPGRKTD